MMVTISVALLLAVAVIVLCKFTGLKAWKAAVCVLCGFYLASTSFAPYIYQATDSLFRHL
jgi:hypothetical protein